MLDLQQVQKHPTKPTDIKETDLMPFKSSTSNVWKWFRLAKYVEYSKQKTSHADYQRAYCCKCLSYAVTASVVYRDSTQGTTSMTAHITKKHTGEEAPILQKKRRSAESSESDSRGIKVSKVQSALPVVRHMQSQSQEQLNVIFVVNVILKMGLPIFMADNEGFRAWLARLNPKFQLKHKKSLS